MQKWTHSFVPVIIEYFKWWAHSDLNRGPSDYESPALTAEPWAQLLNLQGTPFSPDRALWTSLSPREVCKYLKWLSRPECNVQIFWCRCAHHPASINGRNKSSAPCLDMPMAAQSSRGDMLRLFTEQLEAVAPVWAATRAFALSRPAGVFLYPRPDFLLQGHLQGFGTVFCHRVKSSPARRTPSNSA